MEAGNRLLSSTMPVILESPGTAVANVTEFDPHSQDMLILNLRYSLFVYVLTPVALVGVMLNAFSIVVLMHPRMRCFSTNIYLTALSMANIVCLFNFLFLYSFRYLVSYDMFTLAATDNDFQHTGYENFINRIMQVWSPIFTTFQLFAIYLTCAVTVDRWIYLTWPFKVDKICTIQNTVRVIGAIFIFCVIYNLPMWFQLTSIEETNALNGTNYHIIPTAFGRNVTYRTIDKFAYIIFVYSLPFLVLLLVNIGIIQKLIETKRKRQQMRNIGKTPVASSRTHAGHQSMGNIEAKSTLDPKITLMILAVVLAFVFCQLPIFATYLLMSYSRETWYNVLKAFTTLIAALNCCVNFLIYCFFGQNFRYIAKCMLCHPSLDPYKSRHDMPTKGKKTTTRTMLTTARADRSLSIPNQLTVIGQPESRIVQNRSPTHANTNFIEQRVNQENVTPLLQTAESQSSYEVDAIISSP